MAQYPMAQYPDARQGALDCLRNESDLPMGTVVNCFPDPVVEGVWAVDFKDGRRAIVYLGGYKDPLGYVRKGNDFEVEDEE